MIYGLQSCALLLYCVLSHNIAVVVVKKEEEENCQGKTLQFVMPFSVIFVITMQKWLLCMTVTAIPSSLISLKCIYTMPIAKKNYCCCRV